MTWSQNGINYVCQKYGDINECVISVGLVFDFIDDQGNPFYGVEGSTCDIVSLIVFGLVSEITMVTPPRPPISDPKTALDTANGSPVSNPDAQEVCSHDEQSGDQWCYSEIPVCTDGTEKCGHELGGSYVDDHLYLCVCDPDCDWDDQGQDPSCVQVEEEDWMAILKENAPLILIGVGVLLLLTSGEE